MPNPFQEQTALRFSLPRQETVSVAVYDVAGRLVRQLYRGSLGAGEHGMSWDGRDEAQKPAGSGIYFVRATTASRDLREKVLLIR
jgi:flagellar hook assembly protein FlgD